MATSFELNDDEREVLSRVLTSYLSDLRFEISNTERLAMRESLHHDEELIKSILSRLGAPAAETA